MATQNPVDLDYKGLSNTGTWMIGRLQTERDQARVMDGLAGAADGDTFDRRAMSETLAGLGKRQFLLHNVHERGPVVFGTRWVMSYLAGPMTRDQIKRLMADRKAAAERDAARRIEAATLTKKASRETLRDAAPPPAIPAGIRQYWVTGAGDDAVYRPAVIGAAELVFTSARYNVDTERACVAAVLPDDGPVAVDWDHALTLDIAVGDLLDAPESESAGHATLPAELGKPRAYGTWEKNFKRWLRKEQVVTLYRSATMKAVSEPGEREGEFRARLQVLGNEQRDLEVAKLRKRYSSKMNTLEARLLRARQAIERESEQSRKKKLDVAISFGTAILGAVLGRKRVSATSARSIGSAVRSAGGIGKEAGDVERARETESRVQAELAALERQFEEEVAALEEAYDAQTDELSEITVKPKSTDIQVHFVALAWLPYDRDSAGRLSAAFPLADR